MLRLFFDLKVFVQLVVSLAGLYIQVAAATIWGDKRVRLLVWLLALEIAIWRAALGLLSLDDIANDILIGVIFSMPFLR